MNRSTSSRRRSTVNEKDGKGSVSNSRKIVGKRKLEDLDNVFEPNRKSLRRISTKEQKLLKLYGINSEARVNLQRLKPLDIRILSQKCVSEGTLNKSKIVKDFIDSSKNLRENKLVRNDKNLDFTDKSKLVNNKIVTENQESSVCNERLKNIRANSLHDDCNKKESNEKISDAKSEQRKAALKLIEEKLKGIKKNPLLMNDLKVSGKSIINDTVKIIPSIGVNIYTKVDSLKEDSFRSLPSSNSIADEKDNLKRVRLSLTQIKQKKIENNAHTKPLIIRSVDEINKSFSTEKKGNTNVNSLNDKEKEKKLPLILDSLKFKPPQIREFTLKDFGLDTAAKKNSPCTSSKTVNNVDKYLKEKLSVTGNDGPHSDEPKFPSINDKEEEKIKKFSLEELGLSNRKVRTLGLKDFTEPNAHVVGVKDFKVKTPNEGKLDNCHEDLRKGLRKFRLDNKNVLGKKY